MRTLRLSLTGTFILALLGGLSGAVVAEEPAVVTGTFTDEVGEFWTTPMDGYSLGHASAPEGSGTWTASDPRVSGTGTVVDSWEACYLMGAFYPTGCIYWGTQRIDGPDGSWEGTWSGVDDEVLGRSTYLLLMEGTDAYAGWSFVAQVLGPGTGDPNTFSGLIYEGPLPPWEPPAE